MIEKGKERKIKVNKMAKRDRGKYRKEKRGMDDNVRMQKRQHEWKVSVKLRDSHQYRRTLRSLAPLFCCLGQRGRC